MGQYAPNAWGLFDMHGNVCEWTSDFRGPFTRDAVENPRGPPNGAFKVFRGGDFGTTDPTRLSSVIRYVGGLGSRGSHMGFRVALEFPHSPAGTMNVSSIKRAAAAVAPEVIDSSVKSLRDTGGEWRALVDETTPLPDPTIWSYQYGVLTGGNGQNLDHYSSSELSLPTITAKDFIVRTRVTITERVTSDVRFLLRSSDQGKYVAWNNDWFGLAKWADGRHVQLNEVKDKYFFPREIDWAVAAIGNRLSMFVEGSKLYETTDNDHSAGSVALSVKHNGGSFREPEVMILDRLSELTPERIHKTVNDRMREMRLSIDARAAAWVLQLGGQVTVEVGSERRDIGTGGQLPDEDFRLIKAGLAGQKKLQSEGLSKLHRLQHLQSLDLYHSSISDEQLKSAGLPTS